MTATPMSAERRALFVVAASFQSRTSPRGELIAGILGIPFPLRMDALAAKAESEGLDPAELWPWREEFRASSNRRALIKGGDAC